MSANDAVTWEFVLSGDSSDLSVLCAALRGRAIAVMKRDNNWVLSMPARPEDRDHNALHLFAREQLEVLNGLGHLIDGGFRSVALTDHHFGVSEAGVQCTTAISVHGLEGRLRLGTVRVAINGGLGPDPRELAASELLAAVSNSDDAFHALVVVGTDAPTWSELFVAYELVETGTNGALRKICAVSKKKTERFTRTANSYKVLGRLARHGPDATEPPPNPMDYSEALSFVRGIVRAWLQHESRVASVFGAQV